MMKYVLTMNEEQAQTVLSALDFYMRMRMGQWDELRMLCFQAPVLTADDSISKYRTLSDIIDEKLFEVRQIVMPELTRGASFGVYKFENTERAFNVLKAIRSARAWHRNQKGGYERIYDRPMAIHVREEMPQCEVVEDAEEGKRKGESDKATD